MCMSLVAIEIRVPPYRVEHDAVRRNGSEGTWCEAAIESADAALRVEL